ncbi:MAG TPA: universal stress protein [Acidimicrobiales bacterium]|nr:universal stress protein [Acidimicrobiales bacterium]
MNPKKIVVGVDGSPGSGAALAWAIDEAVALGAEVIAVHVVTPILPPASATISGYVPLREFERRRFDRVSLLPEESLEPLKVSGVKHRMITISGRPATEILRIADEEDAVLVVVGNDLHSTMTEIFLGSVAHELTHHVRRPLAIVPIHSRAVRVDALGAKQVGQGGVTLAAHEGSSHGSPAGLRTAPVRASLSP